MQSMGELARAQDDAGGSKGCSQSARKVCVLVSGATQRAPLSRRERERSGSLLLPDEATLTRHCNQTDFLSIHLRSRFTWVRKPLERCPSASTKTVGQDMA